MVGGPITGPLEFISPNLVENLVVWGLSASLASFGAEGLDGNFWRPVGKRYMPWVVGMCESIGQQKKNFMKMGDSTLRNFISQLFAKCKNKKIKTVTAACALCLGLLQAPANAS